MIDGLAAPNMPPLIKMSRSCTTWLCVIGGETCDLGISKVSARRMPQILTDGQKSTQLHISRYLLSRNEDDPGDFI